MARNNGKSKEILVRLLVLYDHLEKIEAIKPRTEKAQMMIDALHVRIEREKDKLRRLKQQ